MIIYLGIAMAADIKHIFMSSFSKIVSEYNDKATIYIFKKFNYKIVTKPAKILYKLSFFFCKIKVSAYLL